jgi:hypothetical protein
MASAEEQLIRRIHDAINRSVAERLRQAETIRSLQAENLRLRRELGALASSSGRTNGGHVTPGVGKGGSHVVFSDNGASVQVRR